MQDYRLVVTRGTYCAEWRDPDGRRRRASLGTKSEREALERVRGLDARLKAERQPAVLTVRHVWEGKQSSLGTRSAAMAMTSRGKSILPHFGAMRADLITEAAVDSFIDDRRAAGKLDGTIIAQLKSLRASLKWAYQRGLIHRAPFIRLPSAPAPKDLRLTREQAARFLAACDYPHLRLFVIIALTTGARKQAILDLTWERVDFDRGLIHLKDPDRTHHSKRRPTVPMNATLRRALLEAHAGATTEHVLEWAGHRLTEIKDAFHVAAVKAGVPWCTPHVLRHSCASWLAESGASMDEIAQLLGHADTRITFQTYARMSPSYLRKVTSALELE
jgi:integrase